MPVGAIIGAAASIGGAILGGKSQKKAANTAAASQKYAADQNIALARENRDILTGYINPYNAAGVSATNALSGVAGQGPQQNPLASGYVGSALDPGSFDDYRESTGYDFRLAQGEKALSLNKWANGASRSGDMLKSLTRYGQDYGSNEYQNYQNQLKNYLGYTDAWNNQERGYATDRRNEWINLLTGQQNVGLGAVNALAGVNNNATNSIMNSNNQAAAAQSNAALANGYANSNMWAGIGGALGQAAGQIWK